MVQFMCLVFTGAVDNFTMFASYAANLLQYTGNSKRQIYLFSQLIMV